MKNNKRDIITLMQKSKTIAIEYKKLMERYDEIKNNKEINQVELIEIKSALNKYLSEITEINNKLKKL